MRDSLLFLSVCCDYRPRVFPHSQCVYELPQLWVLSSQHSVCQTVGGLIDTAHAYWEKLLDSVGKAAVMSYRHSMWKRATLKEPNKTPPREREPTSMCKMECIEDGIWHQPWASTVVNTQTHVSTHMYTCIYTTDIYIHTKAITVLYDVCARYICTYIFPSLWI